MTIKIQDLKNDKNNPRIINESSKEQLKKSIKQFGDISGIVFNKKTGELVCGHQRLQQLKNNYKQLNLKNINNINQFYNAENPLNFYLRVVDWDRDKQMAANLVANSPQTQGIFETTKLDAVLNNFNLDKFNIDFKLDDLKNFSNTADSLDDFKDDLSITDVDPSDNKEFTITIIAEDYQGYTQIKNEVKNLQNKYNFSVS